VVQTYLDVKKARGRVVEEEKALASVQASPFGVIPKRRQPGKWRLIVNLSAPRGASGSDGIDKEHSSMMRYVKCGV
jgi:hypothetical protein